jgi:predicted acetyltransferase
MSKVVLRELGFGDEAAFFEGMSHWDDLEWYTFTWKAGMSYAEMLERLRKDRLGWELPEGRVPHTMLYGFVDGKIVGRVSVRHELNEHLRRRGGHIGYSVAEPYRKNGYATEMTRQALAYCRTLGLKCLMVTCAEDNLASRKIIEKLGGGLEDIFWDAEDEERACRYWIDLD